MRFWVAGRARGKPMPSNRPGDHTPGGLAMAGKPISRARKLKSGRLDIPKDADVMQQRFFTVGELARLLIVCDKTVRRWIQDGLLPAHQPRGSGGQIRIAENDLVAFFLRSRRN